MGVLVSVVVLGLTLYEAISRIGTVSAATAVRGAPVTIHLGYPANAGWMATDLHTDLTVSQIPASLM